MSETLGSLVDRLSITNIKLWFVQEAVFNAAKESTALSVENTRKLVELNLQRNKLMTEVDQLLDASIKAGKAEIDFRPKLGT